MLVRESIDDRAKADVAQRPIARLPSSSKGESDTVRTALLRRLSASRLAALGMRSGALRMAQARSGRSFRLDVRQRVIVKALVSRHSGRQRGGALGKHVAYLGRNGAGAEGERATFFDQDRDVVDAGVETRSWSEDRHHFRFIISPEQGDRIRDLRGYVREVMKRVSADLGEPALKWFGVCHFDTAKPHGHVLVKGRRADGRDLVIPRDYIGFGFRARAQEVAQELLGDLSRVDAERRIWRETEADRFTGFDRRLLGAQDEHGLVPDHVGAIDSWAALTRARLRHLERLGLATPIGRGFRLSPDIETSLRTLAVRQDIIRTLNQRRLEGAEDVRQLGSEPVRGQVVRSGYHDELGAQPFVIVRTASGSEHYARLGLGQTPPPAGRDLTLRLNSRGAALIQEVDRAAIGLS